MIIHNEYKQGDPDWMIARAGIPTASEFDCLFTGEMEPRKANAEMPKTYLAKKLAERWLGGPLGTFNTFDVEQGKILEEIAIPWFELETGLAVERPAFITTDDGRIGCSPDGLIQGPTIQCGLEIKAPMAETHVRYLLGGQVPKDYRPQIYGSMFVTQLKAWKFLSYRRQFPAFILQVDFDEEINDRIGEVLDKFIQELDGAYNRLVELNGGPPKRRTNYQPHPKQEERYVSEMPS